MPDFHLPMRDGSRPLLAYHLDVKASLGFQVVFDRPDVLLQWLDRFLGLAIRLRFADLAVLRYRFRLPVLHHFLRWRFTTDVPDRS